MPSLMAIAAAHVQPATPIEVATLFTRPKRVDR
jgi:hypothetical protein